MEEDIKILEEFKTKGYAMLLMKYGDRNTTNLKLEQAIENLIKRNKELEEWKREKGCSIQEVYELFIPKSKIKEIRDKAEVMDYYTLPDVIEDLNKLLEEE